MNDWSRYLFGASIFIGVGVMMLAGQLSEWWKIFSLLVMFVSAAVFLIRSIVEYRRTRSASEASEQMPPL